MDPARNLVDAVDEGNRVVTTAPPARLAREIFERVRERLTSR